MASQAHTPHLILIEASRGWSRIGFRELWKGRELLYVLLWRDLKVRYRQTVLGVGWVLVQPLIGMLIFTWIFNRVARFDAGLGVPYALFVLGGLLPWTLLASGVQGAGNSLLNGAHLISKIYFPRLLLPLAAVLVALVDLAVSSLLFGAALLYYGQAPGLTILALPLVLLVGIALALGVGLWLAALNIRYRDVRVLIPFLLQVWMYATPVVYPLHVLPDRVQFWVLANPATGVIEAFRACVLGLPWPGRSFGLAAALTLALLSTGALLFRRAERSLADVL
jgi:lipopolysaccharide transport system permease protein